MCNRKIKKLAPITKLYTVTRTLAKYNGSLNKVNVQLPVQLKNTVATTTQIIFSHTHIRELKTMSLSTIYYTVSRAVITYNGTNNKSNMQPFVK